jgi:hypothetical protein
MKIQAVLLVGLLAGCGGKKDDAAGGGEKTSTGKAVESKAAPSGPFADFGSTDDVLKKWQGAWVLETGALGHYEAWEVKGNKITTWDGKQEQTRELEIDSACAGRVVERKDGGSSSTGLTFVFEGDTLHTGMGDAGIKKGDKILACGSGKVFVWDGKACVAHENNFGRWENKPTECKLDGGKFTAKRPGMGDMSSTFVVQGDVLMSEQMKGNKVEKAATFADAKTKLATFKK